MVKTIKIKPNRKKTILGVKYLNICMMAISKNTNRINIPMFLNCQKNSIKKLHLSDFLLLNSSLIQGSAISERIPSAQT